MKWLEKRIPPPIVMVLTGVLMWGLSLLLPTWPLPLWGRGVAAGLVAVLGMVLAAAGARTFMKAGTTVDPHHPEEATTLVTSGIYARTRNPMYLGMLIVLAAWEVFLSHGLSLIGPVLFVLYITRFQIQPEERTLVQVFGDPYQEYLKRTRRWF